MSRSVSASRRQPNQFAQRLFAPLPQRYDLLAAVLSFGQDARWRATMVDTLISSHPHTVADIACGPCAVSKRLAKKTEARIVGLDLSADMLKQGELNVRRADLTERITLVQGRGEQLPFADASFDAMTFTYSVALRGRSPGRPRRTRTSRQARWTHRESRVRGARESRVALELVALHATRPAGRGLRARWSGVVGRRRDFSVRVSRRTTRRTPSTGRSPRGVTPASSTSSIER